MERIVAVRQPFDFGQSLAFLRRFEACRADYLFDDRGVTAAISVAGRAVAFRISGRTGGGGGGLVVRVLDDAAGREVVDAAAGTAAHLVGADDDLGAFYAATAGDHPRYQAIVRALHGLHHVRFLTLAEITVYCVLMQRSPITLAARAKRRFLARFGRTVDVGGHVLHAMPELDELVALEATDYQEAIGHARKAAMLPAVVRGVAALGETFLRTAPYAEANAALREIPGIGPFSAAAILLRGLGRMDDLPLETEPFAAPARAVYGDAWSPRAIRDRYGAQVGYWSYYLKAGARAVT